MKIGILAPPWPIPAPAYGGVEAVVDALCRGLADLGEEVWLWAARNSTCPVACGGIYESSELDSDFRLPYDLRHVVEGYAWLERADVDVIHDHTFAGPLIGPGLTDRPIVATNHLPFSRPEQRAIYSAASGKVTVVAISEHQRRDAYPLDIRYVIRHGVDVAASPVGSGKGDADGQYALFVGRMSPEKGVHVAARACKASGVRLKIVARMDEEKELNYFKLAVEPLLDDQVVYLGEMRHREKLTVLADAAVLINPIDWPEPFGLVMAEALACGTPVLAMAQGAAPEIVEHGRSGWLCNTAEEVVACLGRIGEIDRGACRLRAESLFTIERMARDHVALYSEICEGVAR